MREKWFCAACVAQKMIDFPPIDLSTTRDGEGLSRYDKEDYLNSLPVTTLATLVIAMEEIYAARIGQSSLPIWPQDLVARLKEKKLADIEARRIAFEQSEEMDRLENLELARIEQERLRMDEMDAERGKAAATLTSLNVEPLGGTPHSDHSRAAFDTSSQVDPAFQRDPSAVMEQLYAQQQMKNQEETHQRAYDPYSAPFPGSFIQNGDVDVLGESAGLSPSEVESILNGLGAEDGLLRD